MSIAVVGAGLAGLATACRVRLQNPETEVIVIDGKHRQSNTQIAGMRFRTREPGGTQDGEGLEDLLLSRIAATDSDRIVAFVEAVTREVRYWERIHEEWSELKPLPKHEENTWFGPQWGEGRGKGNSVLRHFDEYASKLGVVRLTAQMTDIDIESGEVRALHLRDSEGNKGRMVVEGVVVATGSIGGTIYHSTNKEIDLPFQQIAHQRGIPLVGGSTHMWHPFGRCSEDGSPRLGCYATDDIAGHDVYFTDGKRDTETTELLRAHEAHDNFDAITARFVEHGSVVRLESSDGKSSWARVSHHYSHLGVDVDASARARGICNLWAAGDVGAWHYTHHTKRFPGFALSKCLVDAALIASQISDVTTGERGVSVQLEGDCPDEGRADRELELPKPLCRELRDINTKYVLRDELLQEPTAAAEWLRELQRLELFHPLIELSKDIAVIHQLLREGAVREPLPLHEARERWQDAELGSVYNPQWRK